MKDTIHLLYTPFTGLGLFNGFRGDDWFEHRMLLFLRYTLPSIMNQTTRDFVHWISFRPEERYSRVTTAMANYMRERKYKFIFTFEGLCFWDDKYPNDNLPERLERTLPSLKRTVGDAKYVYKTIVPSDDMYHKDAMATIQSYPFREKGALVHHKGYVFNEPTKQLAEWLPKDDSFPPFYTIMYPSETFLDPKKHYEYVFRYKTHEDIPLIYDTEILPDWRYCVLVHENNISTNWYMRVKGNIFKEKEKKKILKHFGVTLWK